MPFRLALLTLFLFTFPALAQGPAGTVLYFTQGSETYLLLADDIRKSKGWSGFGGAADEGETFQQTAVRETYEETRGYFSKAWLTKKTQAQPPFRYGSFTVFFIEIPFTPAPRVQNHPIPEKFNIAMYERQNYAWVPAHLLHKAIKSGDAHIDPLFLPGSSRAPFFHSGWLNAMKAAFAQKMLPWQSAP